MFYYSFLGDMMSTIKGIGNLLLTIVASLVLILLGIIYFMVTIWMIKIGAIWAGYPNIDGTIVVLTAGIVTAATTLGSALQR